MGDCCSRIFPCFSTKQSEEQKPLLKDDPGPYIPYQRGSVTSARRHPSRPSLDKGIGVGAKLRRIIVGKVGIDKIDNAYETHSEDFNDCYDRFNQLKECYHRMLSAYDSRGTTHSNLSQVFTIYQDELEDFQKNSIEIKRKHQYCMQLHFNGDKIPGEGAKMFEDFNVANLITKHIAEKEAVIVGNVKMLINKEKQFKQMIVDHYSDIKDGEKDCPEKLKICVQNTGELKEVQPFMEYMRKETSRIFEDMKESIRVFAH